MSGHKEQGEIGYRCGGCRLLDSRGEGRLVISFYNECFANHELSVFFQILRCEEDKWLGDQALDLHFRQFCARCIFQQALHTLLC